jgi:hypothetical protein
MKNFAMMTYTLAALVTALGLGCSSPQYSVRAGTPAPAVGPGPRALGLVRVKAPWYAPRGLIASRFRDAVPEYEALGALERKYFTLSDDRYYGGLYVWQTRADAEGFYTDAWRQKILERRGTEPSLLLLDAPFFLEGRTSLEGAPLGERSLDFPATTTLVLWSVPGTGTEAELASRLAQAPVDAEGFVHGFVVTAPGRVGLMGVWATRQHAEAALTRERLATQGREVGATSTEVTYFDAPVLLDAALHASAR